MKTPAMVALYRKNLAALSEKRFDLFKNLKDEIEKFEKSPGGCDGERFLWEDSPTPQRNFAYIRENPAFQARYHGENPAQEAEEIIQAANLEHPSTLVIFGLGLGYNLKTFLKNRPHTNFVILVIENNPQIFLRALCSHDFTQEFTDETITWIVNRKVEDVGNQLLTFFGENTTVDRYLKILATPAALAAENAFYSAIGQSLLMVRDHAVVLVGNSVNDQLLGLKNAVDNIPYGIHNPGLGSLINQFRGKMCISIAAGPSLNEHFDTLREYQGKIPMIACESTLKPLHEHGIVPDFITAMERDDYVPKFFRNIEFHDRSSLVSPIILMKECFDLYKGDKLIYSPYQVWLDAIGLGCFGHFNTGASAGNLNLSLASSMGFKTIVLVGHNLAYGFKSNETHVRGTIDPDRERSRSEEELAKESAGRTAVTQDEQDIVATRFEWDYFRVQMGQMIADFPDRNWINTSPKGARIWGTKTMNLKDALKEYYQEPFDIFEEKKKLIKPVSHETAMERLHSIKLKMSKCLERIYHWQEKGAEIQKKMKKWEDKIVDKELKGQTVGLDFLNTALDEVLEVKVKSVNEDHEFSKFAILMILPAHVAFERSLNEMRAQYKDDYNLKKDFLLRHKQYFEIWEKTFPRIIEMLETFLAAHEEQKISAWGE